MRIKFITRLIVATIILFFVSSVNADETIEGHYCYTYGDKESLKEAKDVTRTLAIRNAIESYRVYIESTTSVRNFTLTNDIIQIVSSGYLKDMKVVEHREEGRTICDTVEFTVSPKEIEKVVRQAVKRRTQAVEEKGIDNNGFLKILSVSESVHQNYKYGWVDGKYQEIALPGVYTDIDVRIKVVRKISTNDEHCRLFIVYYDSEGKEIATVRKETFLKYDDEYKKIHGQLYPGEIVDYHFRKMDDASSYKIWLYDDKKVNDISESKKPMRKKKKVP